MLVAHEHVGFERIGRLDVVDVEHELARGRLLGLHVRPVAEARPHRHRVRPVNRIAQAHHDLALAPRVADVDAEALLMHRPESARVEHRAPARRREPRRHVRPRLQREQAQERALGGVVVVHLRRGHADDLVSTRDLFADQAAVIDRALRERTGALVVERGHRLFGEREQHARRRVGRHAEIGGGGARRRGAGGRILRRSGSGVWFRGFCAAAGATTTTTSTSTRAPQAEGAAWRFSSQRDPASTYFQAHHALHGRARLDLDHVGRRLAELGVLQRQDVLAGRQRHAHERRRAEHLAAYQDVRPGRAVQAQISIRGVRRRSRGFGCDGVGRCALCIDGVGRELRAVIRRGR